MKYEYNGHLLEDDRINLVANEIINKYPHINIDKAKEAAMLEGKISTAKTFEMEFNRLYNIMLVISDDKKSIKNIYLDLINLLNNNQFVEKNNYYHNIALEIALFLVDEREFPIFNEF